MEQLVWVSVVERAVNRVTGVGPGALAAVGATVLAVSGAAAQLRRLVRARDGCGVSLTSACIGIGTELAWVVYTVSGHLWFALPEALLMAVANVAVVTVLLRNRLAAGHGPWVGAVWFVALLMVAAAGGHVELGVVLAGAYAVQVAPAVWTVWTTVAPTGVAGWTWVLLGAEGLLWCCFGVGSHDPAMMSFAVMAVLAASATLARKAVTRSLPVAVMP